MCIRCFKEHRADYRQETSSVVLHKLVEILCVFQVTATNNMLSALETMVKSVSDWVTLAFDIPSVLAVIFGVPIRGHLLVEGLLLIVILFLLSQKSYKPPKRPLTKKEVDELCDEWVPESLIPPIIKDMKYDPPILESAAGPHTVVNGIEVVNFTSANYLGLLGHNKLQRLSSFGYVFSASLPPYLASASITAIDVLEENPNFITKLNKNIASVRKGLSDIQGLEIVSDPESPIVFMRLKNSTRSMKSDLQVLEDVASHEHAVFVATSKRSTLDKCNLPVGIRLCVSAGHAETDLMKACESLKKVCGELLG